MSLLRLSCRFSALPRLPHPSPRRVCTSAPAASSASAPSAEHSATSSESSASAASAASDSSDPRAPLYDAALRHIPTHGWTDAALHAAVAELGWSPASVRQLPRGPADVAAEFVRRCNRSLAERLASPSSDEEQRRPDQRAAFAIRTRIHMLEPFHDSWAAALALQASPASAPAALRMNAFMIDEIAHFAGYRSPDFSWYTDRAVLGMAYQATELYWLSDKTLGREDTWRFLERRLKDSHALRTQATSAYNNLMTFSDATVGSLATIVRSTRRSY